MQQSLWVTIYQIIKKIEQIVPNDGLNLIFCILGISLTMFTVVYSFILNNKTSILDLQAEYTTTGTNKSKISSLIKSYEKSINTYKKINEYNISLILYSVYLITLIEFYKYSQLPHLYSFSLLIYISFNIGTIIYICIKEARFIWKKYLSDIEI